MAPKRKYVARKRKYTPKRKPVKRAANSSLATQVVSAIGGYALKRLKQKLGLNTETKYVDTANAVTNFTTTLTGSTTISNFSTLVPQGLTDNTRSGNTFRMTRYRIKGELLNGVANLVVNTVARIVVVNWGKTPQPAWTTADILEDPNSPNSEYTMDPSYPHTVLYDKTFCLGATLDATNSNLRNWEFDYRPLSHHVRYTTTDTTGAIANCVEGAIVAYLISGAFTAGNPPFMSVYQRMEYVDN